jgi:hypothetical protein
MSSLIRTMNPAFEESAMFENMTDLFGDEYFTFATLRRLPMHGGSSACQRCMVSVEKMEARRYKTWRDASSRKKEEDPSWITCSISGEDGQRRASPMTRSFLLLRDSAKAAHAVITRHQLVPPGIPVRRGRRQWPHPEGTGRGGCGRVRQEPRQMQDDHMQEIWQILTNRYGDRASSRQK